MTVSVAMCTYNGERFLLEQLQSIGAQSHLPDELIVCDDGSTDGTLDILEAYAKTAPFAVHITVNPSNLGSTQNFAQAVSLCRCDLIFLCDQDDIWRTDKVETMHAVFAARPEVGLVFTDAEVVDEQLHPTGKRLWQYAQFGPKQQQKVRQGRAFEFLCEYNVVTGATMAFRSRFKPVALPIPRDIALIHDGWIALIIAAYAPLDFLSEPLIQYRQHPQQQMGVALTGTALSAQVLPLSHYQAHIRQLKAIYEHMLTVNRLDIQADVRGVTRRLRHLAGHKEHIQRRLKMPRQKWRRVPSVAKELLTRQYHRYSNGWRSAVRDLFY